MRIKTIAISSLVEITINISRSRAWKNKPLDQNRFFKRIDRVPLRINLCFLKSSFNNYICPNIDKPTIEIDKQNWENQCAPKSMETHGTLRCKAINCELMKQESIIERPGLALNEENCCCCWWFYYFLFVQKKIRNLTIFDFYLIIINNNNNKLIETNIRNGECWVLDFRSMNMQFVNIIEVVGNIKDNNGLNTGKV